MSAQLQYTSLDEQYERILNTHFGSGFIRCQGTVVHTYFKQYADELLKFEVRDDDVWVCAFSKTGSTWVQEMVWCIANELDFKGAEVELLSRCPILERTTFKNYKDVIEENPGKEFPRPIADSFGYVRDLPSPRFIKTHMPFHLLPLQLQRGKTKAKIIYVARNEKDTCLSYYHWSRPYMGYTGSLEQFATLFINDSLPYAPFWTHVLSYYERRNNPNIFILTFNEMKQDLPSAIRKIAAFLGKTLTNDQVKQLCEHLSIENMRKNPAVNQENLIDILYSDPSKKPNGNFCRRGQVGDWKKELPPEWIEHFEKWTAKNLKERDIKL